MFTILLFILYMINYFINFQNFRSVKYQYNNNCINNIMLACTSYIRIICKVTIRNIILWADTIQWDRKISEMKITHSVIRSFRSAKLNTLINSFAGRTERTIQPALKYIFTCNRGFACRFEHMRSQKSFKPKIAQIGVFEVMFCARNHKNCKI